MVNDPSQRRREYARKVLIRLGKDVNGQHHARMSFLAHPETRSKIEQVRAALAARTNGQRNCTMSDVIRYAINVVYFDLIGERPPEEEPCQAN